MAERLLALERATGPAYRFRSRLEGTNYRFRLAYNTRADLWTLAIKTSSGEALVDGYALRAGEDVLTQLVDARLPAGTLTVVDTSQTDLDPGRADLGARVRLVFTPEAEVAGG